MTKQTSLFDRCFLTFPIGVDTRSGEEGLSSCLKCPCNRAAAYTPPEESPVSVSFQDFLLSSPTFKQLDFRIHAFRGYSAFTVVTARLLAHHPYSGFVNRLQNSSFPPCLLSKLRGSDFFPGRLAFFLLNISALPGRTESWRSQAFPAHNVSRHREKKGRLRRGAALRKATSDKD